MVPDTPKTLGTDGWLRLACAFDSSGGSTSLTSWTRCGVRVKARDEENSALSELEFTRVIGRPFNFESFLPVEGQNEWFLLVEKA